MTRDIMDTATRLGKLERMLPKHALTRFRLRSFCYFFFLVAIVQRMCYAIAEPTFLKAQPRFQCHPRVKAPTDEQDLVVKVIPPK